MISSNNPHPYSTVCPVLSPYLQHSLECEHIPTFWTKMQKALRLQLHSSYGRVSKASVRAIAPKRHLQLRPAEFNIHVMDV
jgi:hypothetical protein